MVRTVYIKHFIYLERMMKGPVKKRKFRLAELKENSRPGKDDLVLLTDVSTFRTFSGLRQIKNLQKKGVPMALILAEAPAVLPYNYMKIFHRYFSKIYTWNDNLVDGKKYKKYVWPQVRDGRFMKPVSFKKKKLLCVFVANKRPAIPFYPGSLHAERIRAMRFFDKEIPGEFALYGNGWDRPVNLYERIFGVRGFSQWKGWADDKLKDMAKFKFCICYENMRGPNGYITEKIWDAFKARCIPIYLGPDNIADYFPKKTFIDRRDFSSDVEVLAFIQSMSEKEYAGYMARIEKFLRSKDIEKWFEDVFAERLLAESLE